LTFGNLTSYMNYILPNPNPNTACALSVSVYPQSATRISILPGGASGATTIDLTAGAWNPIVIYFITPATGPESYGWAVGPATNGAPTAAEVGNVWATNWAISTGYEPATLIRGSLFVPYGRIHADDVVLSPGLNVSVLNTLNDFLNTRNYFTFTLNSSGWSNLYTVTSGSHGFIKINCGGGATVYSMVTAYFERTDRSYTSLTQIASSGNVAQGALNTTNTGTGTMQITIQLAGNIIQARSVPVSLPIAVRVTNL
jgi:hypothetical protein